MAENNEKNPDIIDFWESSKTPKQSKKKINIFDDFNTDKSLEAEVSKVKKKEEKDIFSYLTIFSKILQVWFLILFFIVLILWIYLSIQKSKDLNSQSFLDPICQVFSWDIPNPETNCASITYSNAYYKNKLEKLKDIQTKSIVLILPTVYEKKSFENSKEVSFLLDKTKDRLSILEVLSEFDKLKNNYTWFEKRKIICKNFLINSIEKELTVDCSAYSKWYEWSIKWFSGGWKSIKWTSISVANSFLNFIEKKSEYFSLLERQKIFKVENIIDSETAYTKKTNFKLKLKINK